MFFRGGNTWVITYPVGLDNRQSFTANDRMDLHSTYPGLMDLKARAQTRLPKFVWDYLDSGTGSEATKARNRAALDRVGFLPSILHGQQNADLATRFLGHDYPAPFGIAPVGMSGLVWPEAEPLLARAAAQAGLPYSLSTVASLTPEEMAPDLGQDAWFQLYPPKKEEICLDLLKRARDAGFKTLVLTVDVPVASRRERQTRSGLTQPPKLTPRLLAQIVQRPAWTVGMARQVFGGRAMPRMRTLDKYVKAHPNLPATAHIGYILRTSPDHDYLRRLRDHWDGPFIIKGVMRAEDCESLENIGVDALWVSNHAGRQFDGAPATIEVLPDIRAATRLPLVFDSGIEGGLDILRALAMGADFVMLGRAFHFGLAAIGAPGPAHVFDILAQDMRANMGQLGAVDLQHLPPPIILEPVS